MRRGKGLALLASPWSPPPWLKTNGSMLQGGAVREGAQDKWAAYIDRYLSEMKAQGLPVGYLSVQNEAEAVQPWESLSLIHISCSCCAAKGSAAGCFSPRPRPGPAPPAC